MIRRILLVAAAAVALILAPSAAMAYDAPGYSSSVSDSSPAVGHPITVTVNGHPKELIKLVVTSSAGGVKTFSQSTNANGVVKFTFKLDQAGVTTIQAFNAAGQLVSDQTVTVSAAADVAGSAVPTNTGSLPFTGFDGIGLAVGGGALVLVGAGAVVIARRRRTAKVAA